MDLEPIGRKLPPRRRGAGASRKGGDLFLWTVAILILIAIAIACWIFSFYVFGHPEKAFSYEVLTKLHKLDPPKRFELTEAPRGDFLSASELWERYNAMSDRELARTSQVLLRNYLRNFKRAEDPVPYVIGSFEILDSYELSDKNYFLSGVVALAQSTKMPQVLLEQVFTADKRVMPTLQRMLLTGAALKLDRTVDLSALINVRRLENGRLQFTAIPLLYGSYAATTGMGTFSLTPPAHLNAYAGLPILNEKTVLAAQEKLAAFRLRTGLKAASTDGSDVKSSRPQLVRVERPKPLNGSTPPPIPSPTPATAAASPTPLPPDAPVKRAEPVHPLPATATMTGVPTAPAVPASPFTTAPAATLPATALPNASTPPAAALPAAALPAATPPVAIANTASGSWSVYPPSQMPRGRLLDLPDMQALAGQGTGGERIYLQGNFVVTASGRNRAVLRSQSQNDARGKIRVIAEFPASSQPPPEGSTFSRDSRRPFLITDVRRAADGQVNVYVREITSSQ